VAVLWPPIEKLGDKKAFNSSEIFLKTNFDFVYNETINVPSFDNVTKSVMLETGRELIIASGNAFDSFFREESVIKPIEQLPEPTINYIDKPSFEVDSGNAFLISTSRAIRPLVYKQTINITEANEVRHYNSNYLTRCTCLKPEEQYDCVTNVLRYSKADEEFIPEDNEYYGHNVYLLKYLFFCRRTGRINSYIKNQMKEGTYD